MQWALGYARWFGAACLSFRIRYYEIKLDKHAYLFFIMICAQSDMVSNWPKWDLSLNTKALLWNWTSKAPTSKSKFWSEQMLGEFQVLCLSIEFLVGVFLYIIIESRKTQSVNFAKSPYWPLWNLDTRSRDATLAKTLVDANFIQTWYYIYLFFRCFECCLYFSIGFACHRAKYIFP